jgi:uncharacterized protein (DUF2236 family)
VLGVTAARTHAQRLASRDGYFAPESVIRRVGNSPLTPLLGGGPAVLLQVANPLVAAGVVQHSDYQRDLWRRLVRTLRALYLMAFGTKTEAERAGETVRAVHARVAGTTETQLGRFPPGTPYSASDPELMLWVHATLVHCSLQVYERFVRPLTLEDEERYYREMALVAELFGTPASVIPPALADFREYLRAGWRGRRSRSPGRPVRWPRCSTRRTCQRRCVCSCRRIGSQLRACCQRGCVRSTGCSGRRCTSSRFRSRPGL